MKRYLLLGLLLGVAVLVALTAVALLQYGHPDVPSSSDGASGDARVENRTSAAGTGSPAAPTRRAPDDVESRNVAPAEDEAPSTDPWPTGELVEVEIVQADTGAPVPHARVRWWPIAGPLVGAEGFEAWLRTSSVEEHEPDAVRLQADREGRVWVSDSEFGFVVLARTKELWGYAAFGPERPTSAQVQVGPDLNVEVQVVDEGGRAVDGVLVALREHRGEGAFTDHLTARTREPDGLAVLRHARSILEWVVEVEGAARAGPRITAAVPGIFDSPVEAPVDLGRTSGETLRLVLPRTGSCEVVVEDGNGRPIIGEMTVRLRFSDRGWDAAPGGMHMTGDGGRLLFEQVALGRDLLAEVSYHRALASQQVGRAGPTRPGERVELRARLDTDLAVWRGRLLDPNGAAIRNATALVRIETPDPEVQFEGTAGARTLRTADDGRFAIVNVPLSLRPEALEVAVYGLSDLGGAVSVARSPAPEDVGAGVHELGDFVLRELPVAAEGEVVDGQGEPVARASVTPTLPVTDDEPRPVSMRWPPRIGPLLTDERGRFELRAEVQHEKIALAARKGELTGEAVVVRTGARGVRLVVAPSGAIDGWVLLDPDLLRTPVVVEAVPESEASKAAGSSGARPVRLREDGGFAVSGLATGTYTIRFVHEATERELGSVSEVLAVEGQWTRDPRLDPLDLRGAARLVELVLVDEWDKAVPGAQVFSRPSGDHEAAWSSTQAPRGRVKLLADARPLDVSIVATGFLRKDLERVDGNQRVVLFPAGRLRFQIAAGLPLPEPPLRLGIEVTPLEDARRSHRGERQELDGDSSTTTRALECTPEAFEVRAGGDDQLVEIRFDPADLAAAVSELRDS